MDDGSRGRWNTRRAHTALSGLVLGLVLLSCAHFDALQPAPALHGRAAEVEALMNGLLGKARPEVEGVLGAPVAAPVEGGLQRCEYRLYRATPALRTWHASGEAAKPPRRQGAFDTVYAFFNQHGVLVRWEARLAR